MDLKQGRFSLQNTSLMGDRGGARDDKAYAEKRKARYKTLRERYGDALVDDFVELLRLYCKNHL